MTLYAINLHICKCIVFEKHRLLSHDSISYRHTWIDDALCLYLTCALNADFRTYENRKSNSNGSSSLSMERFFFLLPSHFHTAKQFSVMFPPSTPSLPHPHPPGLASSGLTEQHPLYTLSPSLIALMCCDCVGVAMVYRAGGVGGG